MKTEMEKCLAGEWYDCHNQVFLDLKTRTHKLLMKYNSLPYEDKEEKHSLLKKMLGSINGKTNCSTFTKHFVPNLILLTQNKMCILLRWFHLFSSFVYLCISLA